MLAQNEIQAPNKDIKSYELEETTVVGRADSELNKYQSGASVNRQRLDSNPNTNGDIGSVLKILPNVQYNNSYSSSNRPGEITPADISISGGLFYQNNFQIDGFNMNNDLNPTDGNPGQNAQGLSGSRSQGLNIDTSLLESIVVMDSNIGAAYGGFMGGVVEANIRKPRRDGWHFDLSYQYTSDKITQQHISDEEKVATNEVENFTNSHWSYQPKFTKQAVRFNFEGYATEKLGLIGGFNMIHSKIPMRAYSYNRQVVGYETTKMSNHTRRSDNYFLKANYNFSDRFVLEANVAYMPQNDEYTGWGGSKDSLFTVKGGGWQAGLKGIWDTDLGLWTNQFGYSRLQHTHESDKNYTILWRYSADKNWAANSNYSVSEGGPVSLEQIQQTFSYKSDMAFNPIGPITIRVGAELDYQNVKRGILKDYYYNQSYVNRDIGNTNASYINLNGGTCDGSIDFLGVPLCSTATTIGGTTTLNGQWIQTFGLMEKDAPENNAKLNVFSYALYLEDDMKILDSKKVGAINARFGVRFNGDDYMSKKSFVPRFSLAYNTPVRPEYRTQLTFGANRYYARNLFMYKLREVGLLYTKAYTRATVSSPWEAIPFDDGTIDNFEKLEIPYSDDLMAGISQEIGVVNVNLKYINRQGKDEIVYLYDSVARSSYFSNDGTSKSQVVSLAVQNTTPIKTANIYHHYLFAFDWTQTERSYWLGTSRSDDWLNNVDIFYDGKVIKFRDRPTENFARPWTIRLNTTHTWQFKQVNLLWNNFFRYQSAYDRMVQLSCSTRVGGYCSPNWNTDIGSTMTQYGKYHFKGAFTWDMRLGVDFRVGSVLPGNTDVGRLYVNVDIINVLNAKNMTTYAQQGLLRDTSTVYEQYTTPVYAVGRQFWLQVGYKY